MVCGTIGFEIGKTTWSTEKEFDGNGQRRVQVLDVSSLVALQICGEGWHSVSTDCKNSPEQNISNTSQLCLKLKRDPRALHLWS